MDELTLFAELRPDDNLTEADLNDLRAELFPTVVPQEHRADDHSHLDAIVTPLTTNIDRLPTVARRRPSLVAVAAASIAAVGLGGLWVVADRQSNPAPSAPAAQPESNPTTPPNQPADVYDVPLIGFAETGWSVTNASDESFSARRAAVLLSEAGFDGPWIEITARGSGTETMSTVPVGGSAVDVNGQTAGVAEIDDGVILRWTDASGNSIEAFGWQVDVDQTAALARTVTVTDTGVTIDQLPAGASVADAAATDALGHFAGYRFTHTDGREVEVTFQPGSARGLYQRQGSTAEFDREGRTNVMIGGEPATIVDYETVTADPPAGVDPETAGDAASPGGEYRVDIRRGFWTWGFSTARFKSPQQVIDLVAGASIVEDDTWQASLADNIVAPDERADAVHEVLTDVPLPPGFSTDQLTAATTEDRYQFIAEVSGAVACGWFDEWSNAGAAGDTARRATAAAAIATSRDWPMLIEVADQGGWAQAVWGLDDHINADPTHEGVEATLGCERFD